MKRRSGAGSGRDLLRFLLAFGSCWKLCHSQVSREEEEVSRPPDGDDGAFLALRSCHQLLHGDTGEFFSPDYLCSNPPLWCNWTIQVDPGKRVHLHLQDLTPDDQCHLKRDQVHVDDPTGHVRGHKVLQRCWREVKYTSSSDTLQVVLLIGGRPSPPYRGVYGRYQAFGPPVVQNLQDGSKERNRDPSARLTGPVETGEEMEVLQHPSPETSDLRFEYYDQPSAMMEVEQPWEPEEEEEEEKEEEEEEKEEEEKEKEKEEDEIHHPASDSHVLSFTAPPTAPESTPETSRSGRGATESPSGPPDSEGRPPPVQHDAFQTTTHAPTPTLRNVDEALNQPEEERSADGGWRTEVSEELSAASEEPEPEGTEQNRPPPNMVELLLDHRGNHSRRNHTEVPHLPGDHLFEVAVEVDLSQVLGESWENLSRSLLLSVKSLINEQLKVLHLHQTLSSKRAKRLSSGVLYIIWVQLRQKPGYRQVHDAVHSSLDELVSTDIGVRGHRGKAVIASLSTADVNECGTQLLLCDVNADCINRFGSYSCLCRPGFQDHSRLGSGGTACVDLNAAGCSSDVSAETKGVFVLFFLLSSLILMLLVAVGVLYHRHRRGAFPVSPPDPNNMRHEEGYSLPADSDPLPPPPPPPARGLKEGCSAPEPPLLSFSPLLPPERSRM